MPEFEDRKQKWNTRYETGDLPWDSGRHDANLRTVIAERQIQPCRTLELGCGTGTNAIWLAEHGFTVTALDISATALAAARAKAKAAHVDVTFHEIDMHRDALPSGPFDFVFDRGCFHSSEGQERDYFAAQVHAVLAPAGLWFSLMGSDDAPPRDSGPPRLTAREIATRVESRFEILCLKATHFDSDQPHPAAAWACLMRRRKQPSPHNL